jgi:tRNA(fMet)-specific endonuclease VapC
MMYLLDTNHCSQIINGNLAVIQAALSRRDAGMAINVITQGELLFMAENSEMKATNLERVQTFLDRFDLYPINADTSIVYARLKAKLIDTFGAKDRIKRRGIRIQELGFDDNDLWIAATAIQYGLILVSADSDFDRITQVEPLQVESWLMEEKS